MLLRNHLQCNNVLPLESSIYEDEIGSKVFVEHVGVSRRSSEDPEDICHALALCGCQIKICPIHLGNGLFNQCRPYLHAALYFLAPEEEEVLAVDGGLNRHEIINNDIPPYSIPAEVDTVDA